jgi:hypothetical protein
MHFTEMAIDFEKNKDVYVREDAVVLRDIHYPTLWFLLMTKNYKKIAALYVRLPGGVQRTESQLIEFMKGRLRPAVPAHAAEGALMPSGVRS